MSADWQSAAAAGLAALAACYLVYRSWRVLFRGGNRRRCAGCMAAVHDKLVKTKPLVPVESLTRTPHER